MNVPESLWRSALGAAVCAIAGALLPGAFLFVMMGLDPDALGMSVRVLLFTAPAALFVGLPLHLLVRRVSSGLTGLIFAGAIAAIVWAAVSSKFSVDWYLYAAAALLGGASAVFAYPIVVPRARIRRPRGSDR